MKNLTIARRYAKALFQLANETSTLDDVLRALSNVCMAVQQEPQLKAVLFNPLVAPFDKQKLIKTITSNKLVVRFAGLLADRKRMDMLADINAILIALTDAARGIHRATVKTALPLSDDQKRAVETDLAKSIGGKIIGHFEIAKDLIGGVWIQLGDKVLDASLKGRIEDLRYALINSAN